MSSYFFDTSALAKLYHPEIGTPKVVEIVETVGVQIRISRLTVVELRSVFAIKVRTQVVTREDVSLLLRQFQEDCRLAEVPDIRRPGIGVRVS